MPDILCPICDCTDLLQLLVRRNVPVHQNLLFARRENAIAAQRGDLEICACRRCGFVFNSAFDPRLVEYGPDYDNTQLASAAFQEHQAGLVAALLNKHEVRAHSIVEVGCGKGSFLRALVSAADTDNTGVGFDPSYVGPDVEFGGRLRFERRYYDATCTQVSADVLVCRHVIEHVANPLSLLRDISIALHDRRARIFLETPCVAWTLRNNVVWDLFYEHCSLFTASSLTTACDRAGFSVRSVSHVFGGQYLWLEATTTPPDEVRPDAGHVPRLASAFQATFQRQVESWQRAIDALAGGRKLAVWGAGAKGSTFVNLVDAQCERFACLVDMNPAKQGAFLGGTGHPIVSPAELKHLGVSAVIVLNPNYVDEIRREIITQHLDVDVVNLGRT